MSDRTNEQLKPAGLETATAENTREQSAEGLESISNANPFEGREPSEAHPPLPAKAVTQRRVVIPPPRDELAMRVEKILEADLGDAFSRLSPIAQQEFKLKGEKTARNIRELMKSTHLKVKKIFRLVLEWLRLLPGINRFFLEQEAKIKTDRIIELHKNK